MLTVQLLSLFMGLSATLITVDTSRGSVQGFDHDFGDDKTKSFFGYGQVFLGIPFAKAPLGERRFTLPEDVCQNNDEGKVHDATYYRPRCYQIQDILQPAPNMSEDCLYLNVVTPDVKGKYPVMVYIHGGGLTTGGADVYHWKGTIRNLVSRGVVVVTIQYRVGLIGFFTTYTERFPPNRGFYDQMMALKWVKEEIGSFGGDSDRITIFGQSAGAVSVSHLSLSPLAKGLFHQLIQTSGSALMELETPEDPRGSVHKDRARQICNIDDSNWSSPDKDEALMKCLLAASPEQIIQFDQGSKLGWNPTLDAAFLPVDFTGLTKSRPKYPVLMTDMLEEYAYMLPGMQSNDISGIFPNTSLQLFRDAWPNYDDAVTSQLNDLYLKSYAQGPLPGDNDHLGWAQLTTNIWTGFFFDAYMLRDKQWHQDNGNTDIWLFTFTHRHKLSLPMEVEGWIPVAHCAELPFLWYYPEVWDNASVALTDADFAVANYMGQIYTDFAKNGMLSYARAGANSAYVEIGNLLTPKVNWRQKADDVFNKQTVEILGEFPPLSISKASSDMLEKLGKSVLTTWNSASCADSRATTKSSFVPGLFLGLPLLATLFL